MLGISVSSFYRWRERYEDEGEAGLADARLGRVSKRRAPVDLVSRVLALYATRYWDFTVKHFHEKLVLDHGFTLSYTWTKSVLQANGCVRRAASKGAHRRKRARRPMVGMMLHQDGSRHEWVMGGATTMSDARCASTNTPMAAWPYSTDPDALPRYDANGKPREEHIKGAA